MAIGLFETQGGLYLPRSTALSPWGSDRLHGGPVLGLLAHVAHTAVGEGYDLTRFTADLFTRVPNGPLATHAVLLRKGRRIALCDVRLSSEDTMLARASVMFCAAGKGSYLHLDATSPEGPDGLDVRSLIGERRAHKLPPGFHKEVETRFGTTRGHKRTVWFRMPMPLCDGQAPDPLISAIALSDFGNAVSSIAAYEDGRKSAHMNVDTTFYLERPPCGEWFALTSDMQSDRAGVSVGQVVHHDIKGRFGRSLQVRLETEF